MFLSKGMDKVKLSSPVISEVSYQMFYKNSSRDVMSLPPEELLFCFFQSSPELDSNGLFEVKVKRGSRLGFFQNPVLKLGLPSFSSNHPSCLLLVVK